MSPSLAADAAAVTATVLSAFGDLPQLRRIAATGDIAGVSAATAALGVTTELTWFAYSADESLWTAMPESALMALANIALLVLVCGRGETWRPPVFGAIGWAVVLAGIGVAGGTRTLGAVLGAAYLVQVAPAVWTVLHEPVPSGVATSTWVLIAIEALLWGMYGIVWDDPATMTFAVVGAIAAGVAVDWIIRTAPARRSPCSWPQCSAPSTPGASRRRLMPRGQHWSSGR